MTTDDDVMDRSGRAKRLVIGGAIGIACAVVAHGLLFALARPDTMSAAHLKGLATTSAGEGGPWKFVWYFTGLAFIVPASIVVMTLAARAKKRALRERFPEAKAL
ncbi:hypothetical protein BH11MYX1_BH11MYX1_02000 [soil metagenome]